ncbi:MAG: DUF4136 domain-containing protein [Acidobacteria bacterium]|nr:DUF4136 domain-containing protein [Acidobacteriota bacterium]
MKLSRFATLVLAVTAVACSTLEVNTDYAPGTDFSKYKTFTLKAGTAPRNPIAAERFAQSLGSALAARGLRQVPDGGDLIVVTHFSLGKDTQLNTYGYGGWGGGWRYGGMGGMQTTTVQEIPTGTVVIDLVDASAKTAVWRGIAKDQISTSATPEERQQKADLVAQKLFENYPPQAKK